MWNSQDICVCYVGAIGCTDPGAVESWIGTKEWGYCCA